MTTIFPVEHIPELAAVASGIRDLGKTTSDCVAVVHSVKDSRESQSEVFSWKEALRERGVEMKGDALERLLLACAVQAGDPQLELLVP
jgi:hypothetical protein